MFEESNINNDEINIFEILEYLKWEKISLLKIFEFLIKYPKFFINSSLESKIISALYKKFSDKYFLLKNEKILSENDDLSKNNNNHNNNNNNNLNNIIII